MNRNNIQKMLDGIENKYLEEAAKPFQSVPKKRTKHYQKVAVAAAICLLVTGTGVSVFAAKSTKLQNWIASFSAKDIETNHGQGVRITKGDNASKDNKANANESKQTENIPAETKSPTKYYLALNHLPKGYQCQSNDTSIYYGTKGDTDFFTIAYFHLQTDFTNILPQADTIDKYEMSAGTAWIASSKWENRAWILFHDGDYMMEFRDSNKVLSKKEIYAILDSAQLSTEKPSITYKTLEWTKELQKSYEQVLKKYNVHS